MAAVYNYANPLVSLPPSPPRSPPSQHQDYLMKASYDPASGNPAPAQRHVYAQPQTPLGLHSNPNSVFAGYTDVPYASQRRTSNTTGTLRHSHPRASSPSALHYPNDEVYSPAHQGTLSSLLMSALEAVKRSSNAKGLVTNTTTTDGTAPTTLVPTGAMLRYAFLCVLWYMSSALSNNTGKSIMTRFRYPVTLTMIQFGIVSFYCVVFCAAREAVHQGSRYTFSFSPNRDLWSNIMAVCGIKRASKTALHGTLIMSFFQIAGHVFSSMATARMPVSTVHTIKALSPLFTVASYALLFRVRYSPSTYVALIPLTLGVMLACSFDLRANPFGLVCALGSTIIFVSQNIFSKKLLPKEAENSHNTTTSMARSQSNSTGGNLDKINLLLYSSGMAFLLMIPIWAYADLSALLQPKPTPADPISGSELLSLFWLNGSVHFLQCFLAFSILARSSPVAYSIASLIKRVAVICLAILWFGQQIRFVQALGMGMTFGGLYMYNRAKSDIDRGERKRGAIEKRAHLLLPTTSGDARLLDLATPDITPSISPQPPSFHRPGSPGTAVNPRSIFAPALQAGGSKMAVTHSSPGAPPPHREREHNAIPPWAPAAATNDATARYRQQSVDLLAQSSHASRIG